MDTADLRKNLMDRRAELEQQRGVLCSTAVYADLNAVTGAIQQCDWELALIDEGEVMPDPDAEQYPDGIPLQELLPGAVVEDVV